MNFENELRTLLNKCNKENESNTPDFILAQYILGCLASFTEAVEERDAWYGKQDIELRQNP
jgi:hypothetical protein